MSNQSNSSQDNNSETVTVTTQDPKRIKELEKLLEVKNKEVELIKGKTQEAIKRIKADADNDANKAKTEWEEIVSKLESDLNEKQDDKKPEPRTSEARVKDPKIVTNLPARIIKQNTFGGGFRNGYSDGTVKKATKELRATQRKSRVGK